MISHKRAEEIAKEHGMSWASEDDPIYKEPLTIRFISHSGKSLKNTEKDLDKQTK